MFTHILYGGVVRRPTNSEELEEVKDKVRKKKKTEGSEKDRNVLTARRKKNCQR